MNLKLMLEFAHHVIDKEEYDGVIKNILKDYKEMNL